jgi:hypothetical protein
MLIPNFQYFPDTDIGDEVRQLGGIYSAQMLNYTRPSEPELDGGESDWDDRPQRASRKLRLPEDGGIFIDGIPFHHYVLTPLKDKHIRRLKRNG